MKRGTWNVGSIYPEFYSCCKAAVDRVLIVKCHALNTKASFSLESVQSLLFHPLDELIGLGF